MHALRYLKGVYFWVMAISVTVILWFGCAFAQLFVLAFDRPRDGRLVHRIASVWGRALIWLTPGWSASIDGRENLPPDDTPYVIVANHESMSDIFAMYFLGIQFRWMSKDRVFNIPLIGKAMRWADYVSVTRGDKDSHVKAMKESGDRLKKRVPMFFFPEGTRSHDGKIKAFKMGAFRLARDMQVPVLPVAIHGAAELMTKGSGLPGRSHVRIKVLPALSPPAQGPDRTGGETLACYAEKVRQRIIAAHATILTESHSLEVRPEVRASS